MYICAYFFAMRFLKNDAKFFTWINFYNLIIRELKL